MPKISCKYCNTSLRFRNLTPEYEYTCPTCNALVYRSGASATVITILSISTFIVFLWMLNSTLLTVTIFDTKSRTIMDSIIILYQQGFPLSTVIIALTVIVIPIAMIVLILYILHASYEKKSLGKIHKAITIYEFIQEWNMTEVYLLGIILSMVKLDELTNLEINSGLGINFIYIIMFYLTVQFFNPYDVVNQIEKKKEDKNSLFKSSFYLLLALIFIIPSNVLPIMPSYKFGVEFNNTILGGIIVLWEEKDYVVAFIIFFTSICIPLFKIVGVFIMILMAKYGVLKKYKKIMTIYYRVTDGWGKYSMLDVFVVIIIASFIQYDQLVRVEIGTAILPFTLVVFFTMMASKSFDTRLIWRNN